MSDPQLGAIGAPELELIGDASRPFGVTLAFSGRVGGVSTGPYSSLNIGSRVGDDPACVAKNRRILLEALGAGSLESRVVNPKQVHGTCILSLTDPSEAALEAFRAKAEEGADALCVSVPDVPVLLGFADCVPVVLTCEGGFAVVHSGWRGTLARIAQKALCELTRVTGASVDGVLAYLGPHIQASDYEVSSELLAAFMDEFDSSVDAGNRHLSLSRAIQLALTQAGLPASHICASEASTFAEPGRYFSHRRDGAPSGRQGAIAWLA